MVAIKALLWFPVTANPWQQPYAVTEHIMLLRQGNDLLCNFTAKPLDECAVHRGIFSLPVSEATMVTEQLCLELELINVEQQIVFLQLRLRRRNLRMWSVRPLNQSRTRTKTWKLSSERPIPALDVHVTHDGLWRRLWWRPRFCIAATLKRILMPCLSLVYTSPLSVRFMLVIQSQTTKCIW